MSADVWDQGDDERAIIRTVKMATAGKGKKHYLIGFE